MKDMLGREDAVSVKEARVIFFKHFKIPSLKHEKITIEESLRRILYEDIISESDLPEFRRSTVDGYAVRAADTFGATETMPAYLNISGEILMGKAPGIEIKKGEAARISTGGMLPHSSDAVVMFEHTNAVDEKMIEVMKAVAPGEHVIHIGEDIKKSERVLAKGHRIRPQDMGALAGLGITEIKAYAKPRVAIISTGDEIVDAEQKPEPGQVRDINTYNLSGLIRMNGGIALVKGIFSDEYETIHSVVKESLKEADLVIINGGSSVGSRDMTERVINDLGEPGVLVHGILLRPGKPMIIGIAKNKPILGLPGHPAAVTVCFELFIAPIMRIISGEIDPLIGLGVSHRRRVNAFFSQNVASSPGREDHIRVALEEEDGRLLAKPILGKSGLITTLVKADGIVVIPPTKLGIEGGEEVTVELFD